MTSMTVNLRLFRMHPAYQNLFRIAFPPASEADAVQWLLADRPAVRSEEERWNLIEKRWVADQSYDRDGAATGGSLSCGAGNYGYA